jgi:hypothetical protein
VFSLGLADEIGSVDSVARDVIKAEKVLDYSLKDNIAERFAKRLGAGAVCRFLEGIFGNTYSVASSLALTPQASSKNTVGRRSISGGVSFFHCLNAARTIPTLTWQCQVGSNS